jgi:hypothetical protein
MAIGWGPLADMSMAPFFSKLVYAEEGLGKEGQVSTNSTRNAMKYSVVEDCGRLGSGLTNGRFVQFYPDFL